MSLRFNITGTSEVAKALQGVPAKLASEHAMRAMEQAVEPVVSTARLMAPMGETGGLKRSIGFLIRQYRRGLVTFGIVGARRGFGVPDDSLKSGRTEPANYAHLVEYGHAIDGDAAGWVEAKPFLRPAWDATRAEVLGRLSAALRSAVQVIAEARTRAAMRKQARLTAMAKKFSQAA